MKRVAGMLLVTAAVLVPELGNAQAVIDNGTVRLGINTLGHLNVRDDVYGTTNTNSGLAWTGIQSVGTGNDATAPGCQCEGWGVGLAGGTLGGVAGWANVAAGNANLSLVSFGSTASTATSVVRVMSGITPVLEVTHAYAPSSVANLYEVNVTITNLSATETAGSGATGLRYRRVMDWDVEPTAFSEYVKIDGGAAAANVLFTSNDGFASSNPFAGSTSLGSTGDFGFTGAADHGALFDFGFAALAPLASFSFKTFYGTAPSIVSMQNALNAVGAEVYSMAHCNPGFSGCTSLGAPNTFAFGFDGVGGTTVPTATPEPVTMTLLGTGLAGVAAARRRRRNQS